MGSGFFSQDNPPPVEQSPAGPGPGNVVVEEPTGVDGATASFFGRGAAPALQAFEEDAKAAADQAAASAAEAAASAVAAAASAGDALNTASAVDGYVDQAEAAKNAAQASATNAAGSATAAAGSASAASTSATQAATSATNAGNSATSAATSATNSAASAASAASSASQAASSANSINAAAETATAKAAEATTSATNAANSATSAASSASTATTKASEAAASASAASGSATSASNSASSAGTSATTATTKASEAATSANNAATSAATATTKASEASNSATSASGSATSASGSAATATTKASEASTSATNAAASAATATTKASEASTSATNAADSATAAGTSATNAASSASAAGTSATNAATSATNAATSAATATTKASEAAASATSASGSASTATTKASEASTSASNAAASASTASTKASEASTSATNAANSASSASTSATNAANSASAAGTSASSASTSATNAATSATSAANSATAAAGSATTASSAQAAAESARDATLAAFDSFDDRYLGTKTSNPTVDNDGNALVAGALYFNSTAGEMRVWTGSAWTAAYVSGAGVLLIANNLSDLASASTARTNLGLGNVENKSSATIRSELTSGNVTTALGFTPYNSSNPAGYISGITSGMVTTALGYTPYNSSNPAGYISGINSSMVTTALGYTPANKAGDTFTGVLTIQNSNDVQLYLNGNGTTFAGISWTDVGGTDYMWYYGGTSTFAIGGGGSAVASKKLHVNGGTTIGSGLAATSVAANGLLVETRVDAPIFYDSNDTAYFVDPNSTSVLNVVRANSIQFSNGNTAITLNNGTYQILQDPTGRAAIYLGGSDPGNYYDNTTHYFRDRSAVVSMTVTSGIGQANGSFRAPIFYDSDNTGYYVNPAGTSYVLGEFQVQQSGISGLRVISGTGTQSLWVRAGYDTDGTGTPASSPYNIEFQSSGSSGGSFTFVSGNTKALTITSDYAQGAGSLRAPLFYDSDNTAYYLNPESTSVLYEVSTYYIRNKQTGNRALYIDGATWNQFADPDGATKLWLGGTLDPNNYYNANIHSFRNTSSATTMTIDASGIVIATAQMRAPIYYDSNNTSYYLDPSAGNLSMLIAGRIEGGFGAYSTSGTLDWNDTSNVRSGSTGTLLLGTATNGMGGSNYYHPFNFEYSSKDGSGNVTQMAIAYGSPGNKLWMRGRYSGSWTSWVEFLNTGTDTQTKSGILQSDSSLRAPIFYDTNNTAYYVDPAGNSVFSSFNIGGGEVYVYGSATNALGIRTGAGGAYKYFNFDASGNFYALNGSVYGVRFYDQNNTAYYLDPDSTSNLNRLLLQPRIDNYYVGSVSGTDPVSDWQSLTNTTGQFVVSQFNNFGAGGFSNYPSGVYTYGAVLSWRTANHSFQLYASHTGDLAYKTQWGNDNYSGWLTPVVYGRNAGSSSGKTIYGTILYDADNTSYYCDPNTTSILWETRSYYLTNIAGVSDDHRFGVYFSNDRNEHYAITREAGAWASPYPDLRIAFYTGMKFMSESVYGGMRFYNDTAYATQIMSISNSSDGLGAGNVYVNNSLQAGSSLRAPIFYDSNNTSYYCDPNSESVLNTLTLFGELNLSASGINYIDHTGTIYFRNQSGYATSATLTTGGDFTASGNVTAYSDARLKDNVKTVSGALDLVSAMRGVTYTRKDTGSEGIGVIAQEMREIIPQVVQQGEDGTLSVAYGNLVGVLIEAIKELKTEVDNLKATVH